MDIHYANHDVEQLVLEVIDTVRPLINKNNNQLSVKLADDIGEMYSDRTIVQQILLNLISNAAKFTTDGQIKLEVTDTVVNDKEHIVFTVSDTGIGMEEDQINNVFNEFSQANSVTVPQSGGIGLGLNISKRYCTLLDGKISAISKINAGSQFCVILPRNTDKQAALKIMEGQG